MDAKDVKQFLNQAYRLREYIAVQEEQLSHLRDRADQIIPKPDITGVHKNNSYGEGVEKILCQIVDLEAEITEDIGKMVEAMKQIKTAIATVDDVTLRILLEMRYLNFKTWEDIADELYYSKRSVYRLYNQAIEKIHISKFGTP